MAELLSAMAVSADGMRAQSTRIRVISQNIANAGTAGTLPGSEPYQRQSITFSNALNREIGLKSVKVGEITTDTKTPHPVKYIPDHPAADASGLVKMPNVNPLIEMNDMREAQRSYEANLGMIEQSRSMVVQTIGLLRRQ